MSADANPTTRTGPRLWVRIVLVVSLAFNLLIVGTAAGIAIKGGPWQHGGPPKYMADVGVAPLVRALGKEDRRVIAREVRRQGRADGWDRKAHRQSLERMILLLQSTPFDPAAFDAELQITVEGMKSRLSYASQALVTHLSEMSDADRAGYAERVLDGMARTSP